MNQQHKDILSTIGRYGPITTAGIAEILSKPLYGYGGTMSEDELKDQVSKVNGYLKKKGLLVSEERLQEKGRRIMYWSLAESQPEEMAIDLAEIEAVTDAKLIEALDSLDTEREIEERKAVADTTTPEPVSVEFKASVKLTHMSVNQAMSEFYSCGYDIKDLEAFLTGIEFAEKHHGIWQ